MAYREFRCMFCDGSAYAFEGEENKIRCNNFECYNKTVYYELHWEKLPPSPVVIHMTECFMSEAVLDSMDTAIELDRILTREKQHERELKTVEIARRGL